MRKNAKKERPQAFRNLNFHFFEIFMISYMGRTELMIQQKMQVPNVSTNITTLQM